MILSRLLLIITFLCLVASSTHAALEVSQHKLGTESSLTPTSAPLATLPGARTIFERSELQLYVIDIVAPISRELFLTGVLKARDHLNTFHVTQYVSHYNYHHSGLSPPLPLSA